MITPFLLAGLACTSAVCLTEIVRRLSSRIGAVDLPSDRKMHHHPVPRLGGVAVVSAFVLTALVSAWSDLSGLSLQDNGWGPLWIAGAIMFACGLWDDLSPISARTKFIAQLLAAAITVWSGVHFDKVTFAGDHILDLGIFAMPITVLWIVGITNAFNLIDGLDGLSAGLGCIAAATCAAIFFYSGAVDDATLLLILFGALLGFLPYNFNPAKIFLGDSGSLVLGYVLAVMVVTGTQRFATGTAVVIPLLTLGVPIVDTLVSFVRRMLTGRSTEAGAPGSGTSILRAMKQVFVADRDHIHHRLMATGLSHRGAVLALYAVAGTWSTLAFLSVMAQLRNAVLLLVSAVVATAIGIARLGYFDAAVSRIGSAFEQVDRPKFDRSFFFGFVDLLLIGVAYWSAYLLIAGPDADPSLRRWHLNMFPVVALMQLCLFWMAGLYRGLWRAIGIDDLLRVAIAVSAGGALSFSFLIINQPPDGTGSLFVVHTLLLGWLMSGLRSAYRLIDYSRFQSVTGAHPVVIYGAGLGGRLLLRELRQNAAYKFHPVGFIDDDRRLRGQLISGLPVMGGLGDLPSLLQQKQIHTLLLSSESISSHRVQEAMEACHSHGAQVLRATYSLESLAVGRGRVPRRAIEANVDRAIEIRRLRHAIASLRKTAI